MIGALGDCLLMLDSFAVQISDIVVLPWTFAMVLAVLAFKVQHFLKEKYAPIELPSKVQSVVGIAEDVPHNPHLVGCFLPSSGETHHVPYLDKENTPYAYENDMCVGSSLAIHRATWDPALNRSGEYPFGHVFKDRKINWEVRMQMRFKKSPEGSLQFGIELDEYVPLMGPTKAAMKAVVSAFKYIVGEDLYHSVGDDPSCTQGEAERPIFSMPLWAFDQFIETPEGESPPDLADPNFMALGIKRADDYKTFERTLRSVQFRPGPTYTFNFYSISPLMDNINWKIGGIIPGVTIDMNQFCGRPPVHLVVYSLQTPPEGSEHDKRHLDSRKNYMFHMVFWSSLRPPSSWRLKQLLPHRYTAESEETDAKDCTSVGRNPVCRPSERQALFSCFEAILPPASACFPRRGGA